MTNHAMGARMWIVPDCYLPVQSTGGLESHEAACVLNLGAKAAELKFTAFFEDRGPLEDLRATCGPRRTNHVHLEALKNRRGESIPRGVPFALAVESNFQVVVQHTRLDTTQPALALMTTMAFPVR